MTAYPKNRKKPPMRPLRERVEQSVTMLTECGCWIWDKYVDENGYGTIRVEGKMIKAHQASWIAFRGRVPDELNVLHTCDIRCCVNPDHLFVGTQADNMQDMYRKGRAPIVNGEKNPNRRLTTAEALAIKQSNLGCVALSRIYGISANQASFIKLGKSWSHL